MVETHDVRVTRTPRALRDYGRRLALLFRESGADGIRGAVVLLEGDLGAGKTLLVQAMLAGLGVSHDVKSPSFDLVHRHDLPDGGMAYHVDLYRLREAPAPDELDVDDPDGLVLVEWGAAWRSWYPRRWEISLEILPDDARRVTVEHVDDTGDAPRRGDGPREVRTE